MCSTDGCVRHRSRGAGLDDAALDLRLQRPLFGPVHRHDQRKSHHPVHRHDSRNVFGPAIIMISAKPLCPVHRHVIANVPFGPATMISAKSLCPVHRHDDLNVPFGPATMISAKSLCPVHRHVIANVPFGAATMISAKSLCPFTVTMITTSLLALFTVSMSVRRLGSPRSVPRTRSGEGVVEASKARRSMGGMARAARKQEGRCQALRGGTCQNPVRKLARAPRPSRLGTHGERRAGSKPRLLVKRAKYILDTCRCTR
jgi:hypothetical protein